MLDKPRHQARLDVWEQDAHTQVNRALVRRSKWEKQRLGTQEKYQHFLLLKKTARKRNYTAALLTSPVHVLEDQTFPGAQTTLWASCVNFLQAAFKLSTTGSSFSLQMIPKLIFCYRTILLNSIRQDRKYNQWGHFKVGQISNVLKVCSPVKTSGWAPMTSSLPSKYQLAVLHLHLSLPSKISCKLQFAFGDILIIWL